MEKNGKRYFTQKELEKHINKRLIRERRKYDGLELLRNMLDELINSGKIDADSYAEAAGRLGEILASGAVGNMRTSEEEKVEGPSSVEADIGGSAKKDETEESTVLYADEAKGQVADIGRSEEDISENDDDLPMETLDTEDDIREETSGHGTHEGEKDGNENADISETLAKICSSLIELVNAQKASGDADDGIRSARRELCSTGFSKRGASDIHTMADGLTPMQRELAKRAGLSYREYAQLLSEIPKSTRKKKTQVQSD